METRVCKTCQIEKELTKVFFRLNSMGRPGFSYICKSCVSKQRKASYPERAAALCAYAKRWRKENPDKVRNNNYRRYGLSTEKVLGMLKDQGGNCAICEQTLKTYFVDHCHNTGRVRGILCGTCNTGLGKFGDDFFTVIKAASYLRKFLS